MSSSSSSDSEEFDPLRDIWWLPISVLAIFAAYLLVATSVESMRRGERCLIVRIAAIVRNQAIEGVLHRALSKKVRGQLADLDPDLCSIFVLLDVKGSGVIEERALEGLVRRIDERYRSGMFVPDRDIMQVKGLLLEIFNANVDGMITPGTTEEDSE